MQGKMKMQDVLFAHDVAASEVVCYGVGLLQGAACYDKDPGVPVYVINKDGATLEVNTPHRVFVPMNDQDPDAEDERIFTLVKTAAEHGSVGIEWDGSFHSIRSHFESHDLPLDVVVKNPETKLDVPANVKTLEHPTVSPDRFYSLTRAELLGRLVRQESLRGYLVFNPKGVLTVFLEDTKPSVKIVNQE